MSYVVLARKWRPMSFDDLIGQEHVSRTLGNAIQSGRVAHAFLFTGVRGVGKTTSARILAKALNCIGTPEAPNTGPTVKPCLVCAACKEIAAGNDVDVREIDGASYNGVDEVRKSAREQMRQGADHVKIMMSGGVASPYDPLDSLQFSDGEVSAAVEEAAAFGRYVCAHAYSAEAITRAARLGVRTIEHGNLIDDASAKAMAGKGMYLVANLVTYYAMKDRAAQYGMIGESLAKNEIVLQGGLKSLEICKRHGIPVAYGSDLLGELHWDQSKEFTIRQEVVSPIEIIRSATTIGAEVLRMPGKVGTLQAGAFSDAILVDGNPLKDLALLGDQGKHLSLIMKAGHLHKNRLN